MSARSQGVQNSGTQFFRRFQDVAKFFTPQTDEEEQIRSDVINYMCRIFGIIPSNTSEFSLNVPICWSKFLSDCLWAIFWMSDSTSMVEWTTSEQYMEIPELQPNNIVLQDSLKETERSLGKVTLGVECSEFLVKRLSQQTQELQETVNVLQEAVEFKDPELANSEVSGQTFTCIVNRNHVSEAKKSQPQFCQLSSSRDVFESLCFFRKSIPVHVEKSDQFFFTGIGCHAFRKPLCFIDSSKSSCSWNLSCKHLHVKGICLLTNKTSREKSFACGGRESRINRFTIPSTDNRWFAKNDLATTFGTTKSLYVRTSKNVSV